MGRKIEEAAVHNREGKLRKALYTMGKKIEEATVHNGKEN
jgi:hypothetical protein